MPEPIFFLSHFRVKAGQLDLVRQLTSDVAARLQAEKPRTVLFLSYLDADGGTISFLHAFADAESMDLHFVGSDERSRAAYEHIEPLGWELYGNPELRGPGDTQTGGRRRWSIPRITSRISGWLTSPRARLTGPRSRSLPG